MKSRVIVFIGLIASTALGAAWLLHGRGDAGPVTANTEQPAVRAPLSDVGSERCISCHAEAGKAWSGSQHAHAMMPASAESVLGQFDGRDMKFGKSHTRYFRRDGKFWVATEDASGKPVELEVTDTFGLFPLQQYLVSLPDGRKQSLGVAWDARSKADGGGRWFHIFPDTGTQPGNPLHWAGIDQNWNYQCADCHATNLRKGYDAAHNRFNTTASAMNVACEACHGPGSAHVAWAEQPAESRRKLDNYGLSAHLDERKGVHWQLPATGAGADTAPGTRLRSQPRSTQNEIEVCARCHARRGQITDEHRAGDPFFDGFRPSFLEAGLYHPDGQQLDEVYTYGSFLQSRMHAAGVTCSDCHEPHGGKLRAPGNAVCSQCHDAGRYDAPAHHHHAAEGAGAQCVACHMPTTTYMGVDPRHDHSMRIPRPDRTRTLGVPNACASCHAKQGPAWAEGAIKQWFATPKPGFQPFAEAFAAADAGDPNAEPALIALIRNPGQSAIARASALVRLDAPLSPPALAVIGDALVDRSDTVRFAAVRALSHAEPARRTYYLAPLLSDSRRVIRIEAARLIAGPGEAALAATDRPAFDRAWAELLAAENFNADRPEAQVALGDLYAARGDAAAAELAYRTATERDPAFEPAWVNWSTFLANAGRSADALRVLRDGLKRNPGAAGVQHALGLALVRGGEHAEALKMLASAAGGAPDNPRFAYVYAVGLNDSGDRAGALASLRTALKRHPNDRDLQAALHSYESAPAAR